MPPAPESSAAPSLEPSPPTPEPSESIIGDKVTPQRTPLLRLELRDLSSKGAHTFLRLIHASTALSSAVDTVLRLLYTDLPRTHIPPTRSITLVLRAMPGVAYTTGLDLDSDHKEIHLSTDYISHVPEARQKEEILGVLVHEMVHCWQHNAKGTAPGGLIEGVADWVRLRAGLAPPHWKRHADGEWDSGYERTGFFLEWLEGRFGAGWVRKCNDGLREEKYKEGDFWKECCGESVGKLWGEYQEWLESEKGDREKGEEQ
ncbi:BSP-domain-containing protein [Corynespora cassiicola Philippines]|uniref:BSP-domain-containing protein n=1 Tax=Corynespora cassiicola Philippines TaxID=1448308 RepID=A0A2T2P0P6_CORCC|nr:BSP-domain-containing protein [Corynespora cassiicola Philippines]